MTKRGRRRSSRRRRSSSSSKQSVSAYMVQKNNDSNSVSCKDDLDEKGQTDCLRKENVSGSENEERFYFSAPKEKKSKHDSHMNSIPNQRKIYHQAAEDRAGGVQIVTSVSVGDQVVVQQSREPLSGDPPPSAAPGTNVLKIYCTGSNVKLEIQETVQANTSGVRTTVVYINDNRTCLRDECEKTWTPDNEWSDQPPRSLTRPGCGGTSEPGVDPADRGSGGHAWSQGHRKRFHRSVSADQCLDVPPPLAFADTPLEDSAPDPASCWDGPADDRQTLQKAHRSSTADVGPHWDLWSEPDSYEPVFMRASSWTNRSSFTKDFINCQKRKSWIRNNSIATIEQRTYPSQKKRRQTFPGMSGGLGLMPDDLTGPYSESFSSLMLFSLHLQTERTQQANALGTGRSEVRQELGVFLTDAPEDVFGQRRPPSSLACSPADTGVSKDSQTVATDGEHEAGQSETADSGFHQGMSPEPFPQPSLSIQILPPSCSGSEERIEEIPETSGQGAEDASTAPSPGTSSLRKQRFTQTDPRGNHGAALESRCTDVRSFTTRELQEEAKAQDAALHVEAGGRRPERGPARGSAGQMQAHGLGNAAAAEDPGASRGRPDAKEHLRAVLPKPPDSRHSDSDRWGRRRKLFKEAKQSSSAAGSSVTSDITEESVSEDSLDGTLRGDSDRGFYTETFHSSAWMYRGDDVGSGPVAASLDARTRIAATRERTVRISKGSGEYPWGFRIQFSKPIVVTEVDTNGAAEEAGLMVGDSVLAVNGTDVTGVPHSEAAALARRGPDVLTLTVGSDIACCPNTPRPACRGYLHKRTQTGLIKGWRKRWFVLTQDRCLYYYRHKRDEGRRRAAPAVKLEAAEVGADSSLGKPFVFRCRPQAADRVYFFCATSNQDMKRWLEAMKKATHPITQSHVWVDVTRHNSNLPPLAVKSPECLGLLHKLDRSKDAWLQYYCILADGCLYLYSGIRATHAHGGIYLQGYTVREQPHGSRKSTIELKPPSDEFRTFHLCAENPSENQRWIAAFKASIRKWLPLHQALQDFMSRPPEETRM